TTAGARLWWQSVPNRLQRRSVRVAARSTAHHGGDTVTDDILLEAEEKMESAVQAVQRDLQSIRTGRASTALVENLGVDVYGSRMQLNQLANLAAPEAQLITITPFDRTSVD